ncbi:MAG: aldo/keto reductase [Dehalococcoidia bacterium]|nr:aldo/keto reductase [Dehalococcoidia bacterium]
MEYRRLGNSGLKVSQIGLGGNNFGERADEQTSIGIINHALETGINFLDTADVYTQGRSEELVGKAVKGKRSQVIIATKFGNPRSVPPNQQGGSRGYVMRAVEASLRRLNTDYIDLYYFHHPDQQTPIQETLRAMDDLVRTGKVRYIGCSNFAGWTLADALATSRAHHLESFIVVQSRYNLLDRNVEREVVPCCEAHGVGLIPWGPLAGGFLTGKYRRGQQIPANTRLANPPAIYADSLTDANFDKLAKLEAFARERGHTVGELAIAWLLSHKWLGSVIAGVMSIDQLSANMAAATWKLTQDDSDRLDKLV